MNLPKIHLFKQNLSVILLFDSDEVGILSTPARAIVGKKTS